MNESCEANRPIKGLLPYLKDYFLKLPLDIWDHDVVIILNYRQAKAAVMALSVVSDIEKV